MFTEAPIKLLLSVKHLLPPNGGPAADHVSEATGGTFFARDRGPPAAREKLVRRSIPNLALFVAKKTTFRW